MLGTSSSEENQNMQNKSSLNMGTIKDEQKGMHLYLRKQQIHEIYETKRINFLSNSTNGVSKFEPTIPNEAISEDLRNFINAQNLPITQFLENKFNFFKYKLSQNITNSCDIYYILFDINQSLKDISQNDIETLLRNTNIMGTLFNFMKGIKEKNKTIIYLYLKLLLNVSFLTSIERLQIISPVTIIYYMEIFDFLLEDPLENSDILTLEIMFYSNTIQSEFERDALSGGGILERIEKIFEIDAETPLSREFIKQCLHFISVFLSHRTFIIPDKCNLFFNIFYAFMQTVTDVEILTDIFWGFGYLTYFIDNEFYKRYIEDNIISLLIDFYYANTGTDFGNKIIEPIIRIIGNIISIDDNYFSYALYDQKVINFLLEHLLKNNNRFQIQTQIIWVIENFCLGTDMKCLFMNNLYDTLLDNLSSYQIGSRKLQYEIFKLFTVCLNNCPVDLDLINEKLVNTTCKYIKEQIIDNDFQIVLICILETAMENKKENISGYIMNQGIQEVLERWANSQSDEVRMESINLLENYLGINSNNNQF